MSNPKNTVSDSVKAQILLASDDPKCIITKLASKHGITANQIYNWRNKRNRSKLRTTQVTDNFIELVANDLEALPTPIAIEYIQTELKFHFQLKVRYPIRNYIRS